MNAPTLHLLTPRVLSLRNTLRYPEESHPLKTTVFLFLGLAFWGGTFWAAYWFLTKCLAFDAVGELVAHKLLGFIFIVLLAVLFISSLITAFSTFFFSQDLQLLLCAPIDHTSLHLARFLETLFEASWMVLVFSAPVFIAYGICFSAPWYYYPLTAAILILFFAIPGAVGVAAAIALVSLFPARRARDVVFLLAILVLIALFLLLRLTDPEEMLDPDRFAEVIDFLAMFRSPGTWWLPSFWATEGLFPVLKGRVGEGLFYLGAVLSTSAAVVVLSEWVGRRLYPRAWSRSQEGASARVRRGGLLDRLLGAALLALPRRSRLLGWKDCRVFMRDTAQWSQLLLLAALVVLYLYNFYSFRDIGLTGLLTNREFYFINIGMSAFVTTAVAARFLFPAVSLEGRAFWVVRASPTTPREVVWAKLHLGLWPAVALTAGLTWAANTILGFGAGLTLASLATSIALAVGIAGLGVGLGAIYPRFTVENAAKIATGFGGVLYMILGMGLTLVSLVLQIYPVILLFDLERGFTPGTLKVVVASILLVTPLLLCALAARLSLKHGVRALSEMER